MQPEDFFGDGLVAFANRLRHREFSAEAATRACLTRIAETNQKLESFVHVAENIALNTAVAIDRLLAVSTDLGPLMGVPIGVKDVYTVDGMPTRVGSRLDLSDFLQDEGSFVKLLRRAGCVLLGKTRTTEFALGGINLSHPTPWNPLDAVVHRTPGGSSSGSAVAVASAQCAFAVGTDTGGSVRQPAALCGLTGFKASAESWQREGIFALSPTLDSIGWITRSASDAALVHSALYAVDVPNVSIGNLRLGLASISEPLEPEVAKAFESAVSKLTRAGVVVVPVDVPELRDFDDLIPIVAIELIGRMGRRWLEQYWDLIDPVARARLNVRLDAADYIDLLHKRRRLSEATSEVMRTRCLDGWVMPTVPHVATPIVNIGDLDTAKQWNARTFRATRFANLLDRCAISISLPIAPSGLSAGLEISCRAGEDARLLGIAIAAEAELSDKATGPLLDRDQGRLQQPRAAACT